MSNRLLESQWKLCPVVGVSGVESKVRCCKEQYFIRAWNVRSMNQGKLDVVKQEMGFPGESMGKESTCNEGDLGSIPGFRRSPGEDPLENGYPLQSILVH